MDTSSEMFRYGAFAMALVLIIGAWKFGIEGLME